MLFRSVAAAPDELEPGVVGQRELDAGHDAKDAGEEPRGAATPTSDEAEGNGGQAHVAELSGARGDAELALGLGQGCIDDLQIPGFTIHDF